jgi:hypothetical protein
VPDTGGLEEDLRRYTTSMLAFLAEPAGEALPRLGARPHSAAADDPARRELFWQERLNRACVMVTRAIERGEVRPQCDPPAHRPGRRVGRAVARRRAAIELRRLPRTRSASLRSTPVPGSASPADPRVVHHEANLPWIAKLLFNANML